MSGALASREQCPAIPYTPAEYAAEARRVVDEGGVMLHLHARTPDGKPSHEIEDFRAITEAIRAEVGDAVIVNYSTGALGVPVEKRLAYLRELRPEIGALNMGSMNYAKYSARRRDFVFAAVFENSFETIRALLDGMVSAGIRPEHECFDSGHVASLDPLLDMGVLEAAAAGLVRDGRDGRDPADGAQRRAHGRAGARRAAPVGRDRHLARRSGACSPRRCRWAATCAWAWRTTSTCRTVRWRGPTVSWWRGRRGWRPTRGGGWRRCREARELLGL